MFDVSFISTCPVAAGAVEHLTSGGGEFETTAGAQNVWSQHPRGIYEWKGWMAQSTNRIFGCGLVKHMQNLDDEEDQGPSRSR